MAKTDKAADGDKDEKPKKSKGGFLGLIVLGV